MPVPGQFIIAGGGGHQPADQSTLTVATIFITNPITIPPMFYSCYRLGAWMLGIPPYPFRIQLSLSWLLHETSLIWFPLVVGSLTVGVVLGLNIYG
ncbi:MAG: DUF2062 domain-containing protein [Candidatus Competibacteraceae bacterium]